MRLPPPDAAPTEIAQYVDALVQQTALDPKRTAWEEDAQRGLDLYLGNHYTTVANAGEIRVVVNRIQGVVMSMLVLQAGEVPRIKFVPRESGDPPLYYLNTTANHPLVQQLASVIDPDQPLDQQIVTQLKQAIDQSSTMMMQQGGQMPVAPDGTPLPPVPADVLIEVTDATATQALQTVFDGMWDECDAQSILSDNVLNKIVLGIQSTLYEFDDLLKRHVLSNPHQFHVYMPTLKKGNEEPYVLYDELLSREEAIARYPQHAKRIDEVAQQGVPRLFQAQSELTNSQAYELDYRQDTVIIRTAWLRHWPYPMSEQQAVESGMVLRMEIPDPVDPNIVATQYVRADTQQPTAPDRPDWPVRMGIRLIRILGGSDLLLEDRPCEYDDIQIVTNRHVPIPYSWYGQGTPRRLEGLQMALNRFISNAVTHHAYNAASPEFIPKQIADSMPADFRKARSQWGKRYVYDEAMLANFGYDIKKAISTLDVPSISPDIWRMIDLLLSLIDREGNNPDVVQGQIPSANASGELVKSLQQAASQMMRATGVFTEMYLKRLAGLMVHSIIERMSVQDWSKYCSKYPPAALQAMYQRNKMLHRDIVVQVESASGAVQQTQTANLMAARQSGIPVSAATILERLGQDPDAEIAREAEFQKKLAQQMSSVATAPPQEGEKQATQESGQSNLAA